MAQAPTIFARFTRRIINGVGGVSATNLRAVRYMSASTNESSQLVIPKRNLQAPESSQIVGRQDVQLDTEVSGELGPLAHHDYFDVRKHVSVKDMYLKRCHYGHHKDCRNEYMNRYLFGTRMDTDIIDLEQSVPMLQDAMNIVAHIAYRRGIILFLSRSKSTMPLIENAAKRFGEYAHCRYWNPETFTNRPAQDQMKRLPDLMVFLNTQNSVFQVHRAVTDAAKFLIPTVGIVDSNCDPRLITYPIPGNDDSFESITYYLDMFEIAIRNGKRKYKEHQGLLTEEDPDLID